MSRGALRTLSPEEAVALIQRSQLPTVLTEGRHDYIAFRYLERRLSDIGISFLPVGGKDIVLETWSRLRQLGSNAFAVVDQDLWIYTGVPDEYNTDTIVVTDGYSIENDLFIDGQLEALLDQTEGERFRQELDKVCAWYEGEVCAILRGQDGVLSLHPNQVLAMDPTQFKACDEAEKLGILTYPHRLLRGKTLVMTIMRQLNYSRRVPKHSYLALFEMASTRQGPNLQRMELSLRDLMENESRSAGG